MQIVRAELITETKVIDNDPPITDTVLGPILNGRTVFKSMWHCEFEDGSRKQYTSDASVLVQLAPNAIVTF